MNAVTDLSQMTGLQQLQAAFDPDRQDGFRGIGRTMNFHVVELEEGRVVFGGHPDESVYNPIGTVHGGYAATLLDSAVGCAVHSKLKAGQGYTTLELKVAYHRPLTKDTGPVRAEGVVIQLGRRAGFAEGKLTDLEGRLYATATSTLLVFDR
ncbi:PaaI family thioesterase [Phenylobacterium sp. J426]|uniref:PaaI family thioesterase n=1 Tax=Phenylobacterium sp. J426 TaxID=2898439 RepID=UPI002151A327|nr:PaaI family thioesterase [Phenylobacterium sp. J426]MCR5876114.1 PaaI family thioesterase [Phenylobacterium sp. J426]